MNMKFLSMAGSSGMAWILAINSMKSGGKNPKKRIGIRWKPGEDVLIA